MEENAKAKKKGYVKGRAQYIGPRAKKRAKGKESRREGKGQRAECEKGRAKEMWPLPTRASPVQGKTEGTKTRKRQERSFECKLHLFDPEQVLQHRPTIEGGGGGGKH